MQPIDCEHQGGDEAGISMEETIVSKPVTIRLPRDIYLEIVRILTIEQKTRPRINRSDVILMLITRGLAEYYRQRDNEE
jgi:hypothetical protein